MGNLLSKTTTSLLKARMYTKLLIRVCLAIFVVQIACIVLYNKWFNSMWHSIAHMWVNSISTMWFLIKNFELTKALNVLSNTFKLFLELEEKIILASFVVWIIALIVYLLVKFYYYCDDSREYIQGRKFIVTSELNKLANKIAWWDILWYLKMYKCIPLGEVRLPVREEVKQTFVVGKPGSGKTNAFNHIILKIRDRKEKIIIHDFKGDYVEKFYNPETCLIFNPLDKRSVGWCLFNDCQTLMDIEGFANNIIPDAIPGSEPFWNNAARDVLVSVLRYCFINNKKTNKDIWDTLSKTNQDLFALFTKTKGCERGAKHLEDGTSTTTLSIMSNLMQYVKVFEYMIDTNKQSDFSIGKWIESDDQHNIIFITNYAKLKHTLSPMISLFIQTVGNNLLSLTDDLTRRLFFILDEFGQMQNMSTIESLLTASRSKGGSVFIGVQDIGQIDKIYKKETRSTILNSSSNRVVFNCKDHDTAKFFSTNIGETEYFEEIESQSLGTQMNHDKLNTTKQRRKELLITPEDIQELKDLYAFASIGHHNITLTKFKYKKLPVIADAFVQRPELDLTSMIKESLKEELVQTGSELQGKNTINITSSNKDIEVKNTKLDIVEAIIEDDSKKEMQGVELGNSQSKTDDFYSL